MCLEEDLVLNIASSLGMDCELSKTLQFATEMQALALKHYGGWCRTGDKLERITWADAAINAELMAAELGAVIIE